MCVCVCVCVYVCVRVCVYVCVCVCVRVCVLPVVPLVKQMIAMSSGRGGWWELKKVRGGRVKC